jgi:hypothetical protein
VAISSVHFLESDPSKLIGAARGSEVARYLVVGGAGSLEVAPGVRLVTTPVPRPVQGGSREAAFLDLLRQEKELNWTFLSPSALFVEGERTGKFRLGTDQLLTAEDRKSWISFEDFAVAMADEIERPAHMRQRFTLGHWPPAASGEPGWFARARLCGRLPFAGAPILSVTCHGYIRPHRGGATSVRLTGTWTAFGKAEELPAF